MERADRVKPEVALGGEGAEGRKGTRGDGDDEDGGTLQIIRKRKVHRGDGSDEGNESDGDSETKSTAKTDDDCANEDGDGDECKPRGEDGDDVRLPDPTLQIIRNVELRTLAPVGLPYYLLPTPIVDLPLQHIVLCLALSPDICTIPSVIAGYYPVLNVLLPAVLLSTDARLSTPFLWLSFGRGGGSFGSECSWSGVSVEVVDTGASSLINLFGSDRCRASFWVWTVGQLLHWMLQDQARMITGCALSTPYRFPSLPPLLDFFFGFSAHVHEGELSSSIYVQARLFPPTPLVCLLPLCFSSATYRTPDVLITGLPYSVTSSILIDERYSGFDCRRKNGKLSNGHWQFRLAESFVYTRSVDQALTCQRLIHRLDHRVLMSSSLPDEYPVYVPEGSPVLKGLEKLDLLDRHPRLPAIYKYAGQHPLHLAKLLSVGTTYVYLVDPSPEGKETFAALSDAQEVPSGPIGDLAGLLELKPGDALFARSTENAGDPEADCLQVLVGIKLVRQANEQMIQLVRGGYTLEDIIQMLDDVEKARDAMLGTREDRTTTPGKVLFERHWRAQSLQNAPRCYGMNSMVQQPKQVEGPPAPLKTVDNEHDEYQEMVNELLRVGTAATKLNVTAFEMQGPQGLLRAMRNYSELVNTPHLGYHRNVYWGSQQTNCACPQHRSKERRLDQQMGHFGGPHEDKHDFPAGLTCALCMSDLKDKPGCEPGRLHFLGQGVWVRLEYMTQLFFSGLLRHGGTSPLVPDEEPIEGWETRMLLISYPPTSMITGEARHPYSAVPFQDSPLYLCPEMTGALVFKEGGKKWTNSCHYAGDGWVTMEPPSLFNWMARGLLQQGHFALRQLPAYFKVEIDPDVFLSAFSMEVNGERVQADAWPLAPNPQVQEPFTQRHRDVQDELLVNQFDRLMQGIPMVKENKYRSWDITRQEHGSRTKATASGKGRGKRVAESESTANAKPSKRGRWEKIAVAHAENSNANNFPMADRNLSIVRAAMLTRRVPLETPDVGDGDGHARSPSPDLSSTRQQCLDSPTSDGEPEIDRETDTEILPCPRFHELSSPANREQYSIRRGRAGIRKHVALDVWYHSSIEPELVSTVAHDEYSTRTLTDKTIQDNIHDSGNQIERRGGPVPSASLGTRSVATVPCSGTSKDVPAVFYIGAPPPRLSRATADPTSSGFVDELDQSDRDDGEAGKDIDLSVSVPRDRSRKVFRYQFFARTLGDRLKSAMACVLSVDIKDSSNEALRDALDVLDQVDALTVDTGETLSNAQLPSYSASVRNMAQYCSGQAVWINFYHQRTILSETRIVDSIRNLVDGRCTEVVRQKSDGVPSRDWLARLVKSVRSLIRQGSQVIASSDTFIDSNILRTTVYTEDLGSSGRPKKVLQYELEKVTLSHVRRILHVWMGASSSFYSQAQSQVSMCLQQYLGPGCLLLPSIWRIHQAIPCWLFSEDCPRVLDANSNLESCFSSKYLDDLRATLHEVVTMFLDVTKQFDALQEAYLDLYARTCEFKHGQVASKTKRSNLSKMLRVTQKKLIPSTSDHSDLSSLLLPSHNEGQASITERAVSAVVRFLEDSYAVAVHLRDGGPLSHLLSPAQNLVLSNTDYYMPLRELAESRRVMNEGLSADMVKTRAGLFFLQLFRFIFFNTAAFVDCPEDLCKVYFEDPDEFKQYMASLLSRFPGKPDSFFCNKRAFGTTIRSRTRDRYQDYWDASQQTSFVWPPSRDFDTAWKELQDAKSMLGNNRHSTGDNRQDLWDGARLEEL
ncbi:hypothetical protein BDY19DRAFT_904411 [Irpex rosettiformis]|uniref:Uncharacterized protein n=1 Tax=Irpex rosettiformis TaxID=378272 RepID=A0ACB8UBV8_9APHY|nr:hypothetical protein BDY19DRAFT_904411 [Irpex rosettiformis]